LFYLNSQTNVKTSILGWLAFAASLLCKETALLFPFLILCHSLLLGNDTRRLTTAIKASTPYFLLAAVYLAVRIQVMGGFSHTSTPLSSGTLLLTLPSVALFYVRLLVFPAGLSPFYDTPYVSAPSFTGFVFPVLGLLAIVLLLVWWTRGFPQPDGPAAKRSRQVIFFAAWTVAFLVPALNLSALDAGEIAHDRYLYLPSIGFSALAGIALQQLGGKLRLSEAARTAVCGGLGIILCIATIVQTGFWKDDLSLYTRGASVAPNNINAQNNLANIYLETGDFDRGIAAHQRLLKLNPGHVDSYFNLGLAYYNLGDFARSQPYFQRAIELRPTAQTYFFLGLAQLKTGNLAAAEQSLQNAVRMDQGRPDLHAALGVTYESEGKLPLALQEFETALTLNPQKVSIRNEITKVKGLLGQPK